MTELALFKAAFPNEKCDENVGHTHPFVEFFRNPQKKTLKQVRRKECKRIFCRIFATGSPNRTR
jgi:hypothetical protein